MNIAIIAGARPNFMKVAPLMKELKKRNIPHILINTGQHFDTNMAEVFFEEFGFQSNYTLSPSRESTEKQCEDIKKGIKEIFGKEKPTLVIVVGDVNSTLAGAQTAHEMNITLAHIEAGLRSYNDLMPEEYNRVETDKLSDLLFITIEEGIENLKKEGIIKNTYFVGNIMIDTLKMFENEIENTDEKFYFCTLHRGENVDNHERFDEILSALEAISKDAKIYLPLHPRTQKRAEELGFMDRMKEAFSLLPPLDYAQSLFYQKNAKLVLSDSGGIQEETSYLGTPCLTLRTETERPITVTMGTSTIAGVTREDILEAYRTKDLTKKQTNIPLWDGRTSERIVDVIEELEIYGD